MTSSSPDRYSVLRLIQFWFHARCSPDETPIAATGGDAGDAVPDDTADCVRSLLGRFGVSDADVDEFAPRDAGVAAVCRIVRSVDWYDDALTRWAVRAVADFLVRSVAGRSAGGWGNADLADAFAVLGDPAACPDALLAAAVAEASAHHDIVGRMVSSVTCNYRLSRPALVFLVRCVEDAYVAEDDLTPSFLTAVEYQRCSDTDYLRRMQAAAAYVRG